MSVEAMGMVIFPNISTCWHFDDKVAQKYLLEAARAPLVPTFINYDLKEALQWIDKASFPKVFKLRGGAGSSNVRLVRTSDEARALAKQAFSHGFKPVPEYWNDAGKRYRVARRRGDLLGVLCRAPKTLLEIWQKNQIMGREKGYLYFQDFLPDNQFDTRVTIVGDRAFAFLRRVRPGDFRASGSGDIDYDPHKIRVQCVETAFEVAKKLDSQSLAFDFLVTPDGRAMIAEISYCYVASAVYDCPGHWDHKLNWHPGQMWPQDAILIDLLEAVANRQHPQTIALTS
jgi:glutathione synthase/RimK-type ligase-like ATP-grasp enzyme